MIPALRLTATWMIPGTFAIGAQYRIAEPWLLSVGFAYDSSPFDHAEDRTPDMPLDRQIRYATGLQYDWNDDVTVGVNGLKKTHIFGEKRTSSPFVCVESKLC